MKKLIFILLLAASFNVYSQSQYEIMTPDALIEVILEAVENGDTIVIGNHNLYLSSDTISDTILIYGSGMNPFSFNYNLPHAHVAGGLYVTTDMWCPPYVSVRNDSLFIITPNCNTSTYECLICGKLIEEKEIRTEEFIGFADQTKYQKAIEILKEVELWNSINFDYSTPVYLSDSIIFDGEYGWKSEFNVDTCELQKASENDTINPNSEYFIVFDQDTIHCFYDDYPTPNRNINKE